MNHFDFTIVIMILKSMQNIFLEFVTPQKNVLLPLLSPSQIWMN